MSSRRIRDKSIENVMLCAGLWDTGAYRNRRDSKNLILRKLYVFTIHTHYSITLRFLSTVTQKIEEKKWCSYPVWALFYFF